MKGFLFRQIQVQRERQHSAQVERFFADALSPLVFVLAVYAAFAHLFPSLAVKRSASRHRAPASHCQSDRSTSWEHIRECAKYLFLAEGEKETEIATSPTACLELLF